MELDMGMDMDDMNADWDGMSLPHEAMIKRAMDIILATYGGQLASMLGTLSLLSIF